LKAYTGALGDLIRDCMTGKSVAIQPDDAAAVGEFLLRDHLAVLFRQALRDGDPWSANVVVKAAEALGVLMAAHDPAGTAALTSALESWQQVLPRDGGDEVRTRISDAVSEMRGAVSPPNGDDVAQN
jgi:hypothetical protein